MRYLNPKTDLTFHRVFGKHPDLAMSFLNALLSVERTLLSSARRRGMEKSTSKFNTIEWENGADFAPEYLLDLPSAE